MPASVALNLYELNTEIIQVTVTKADGSGPEDLTNAVVDIYFKASADIDDSDASVVKLSSSVAGEVTVTDAVNGVCEFRVPSAVVEAPGSQFWKCDVLTDSGATRRTAGHGDVSVVNL